MIQPSMAMASEVMMSRTGSGRRSNWVWLVTRKAGL